MNLEGSCFNSMGSNRTIVGLKPNRHRLPAQSSIGSNRTIVGLKQRIDLRPDAPAWQQSHHCGIETRDFTSFFNFSIKAAIAPLWD